MKHWILLLYLGFSVVLQAQNTASVQEAMANYDYKTVIRLIDEESASPQLLIQKAKALKFRAYRRSPVHFATYHYRAARKSAGIGRGSRMLQAIEQI